MKILFLAPQPFFQERGTPIAVRLALQVLGARHGDSVDLLTYHEGLDPGIAGVTIHRMWAPRWLRGIAPGVSFQKLIADLFFALSLLRLLWRRGPRHYDLIHAVEESVFFALVVRLFFGVPYIYDMDSSLALQLTESWPALRPLAPLFSWLERQAVRWSTACVPVCDALAAIATQHGAPDLQTVRDISLLPASRQFHDISLREELGITADQRIVLYVGNLERYQGIDLLIEAFAIVASRNQDSVLTVIGGGSEALNRYRALVTTQKLENRIRFIGPRPLSDLSHYLQAADILVSPRIRGNNTPMKVYSYLHSGKPLVATRLATHTQVMDDSVAVLSEPNPQAFATGMLKVLEDPSYGSVIARKAFELAEQRYTFASFSRDLNAIYDRLVLRIRTPRGDTPRNSESLRLTQGSD